MQVDRNKAKQSILMLYVALQQNNVLLTRNNICSLSYYLLLSSLSKTEIYNIVPLTKNNIDVQCNAQNFIIRYEIPVLENKYEFVLMIWSVLHWILID